MKIPLRKADLENALTDFLNGVRIVIDQKEDSGLKPGSAVLIDAGRLLVYGEPHTHATVMAFLEALRDNKLDVVKVVCRDLSSEERASMKALQKLTAKRWKMRAKAREDAAAKVVRGNVERDLGDASWQLLAEVVRGNVNLEALTTLQVAWDNPRINEAAPLLVTRAAWCIGMSARAFPDNDELTILAEKSISTVNAMNILKPKYYGGFAYLPALYAVLLHQNEDTLDSQVDDAIKSLLKEDEDSTGPDHTSHCPKLVLTLLGNRCFLTGGNLDASDCGDDSIFLASLLAKRRGGQLWQTFREEMPSLVRAQPLNGHVVVLVNRLESSPLLAFGMK